MNQYCVAETGPGEYCGRKTENRDLGLCATHNKARLRAERPAPVPKERKSLTTRQPLNKRAVLAPISAKMKTALADKKKAYAVVDAGPQICCSCGDTNGLTHSHVLTVGQFPEHRANPANILLECQECHMIWEHNKPLAKATQASWGQKMRIWAALEPQDFSRFQAFNPHLFP